MSQVTYETYKYNHSKNTHRSIKMNWLNLIRKKIVKENKLKQSQYYMATLD